MLDMSAINGRTHKGGIGESRLILIAFGDQPSDKIADGHNMSGRGNLLVGLANPLEYPGKIDRFHMTYSSMTCLRPAFI